MRDLIFKGYSTFKEFQESKERVASNILASRLKKLMGEGLIQSDRSEEDRRVIHYRPTRKGLDLVPVMIAMMTWTDKHEAHVVPRDQMTRMVNESDVVAAEFVAQFETAG